MRILLMTVLSMALSSPLAEAALPSQPTEPSHPGSAAYSYEVEVQSLQIQGRQVDVFLPKGAKAAPVVVYGHGQAIGLDGYDATFTHLARKGVAVIFPQFDNGFFDQDWRRMARDFNQLTAATLEKYPEQMDSRQVVFAGHSKGAYIALMAAGDAQKPAGLNGVVLFAPAGFDAEYLQRMEPSLPVSVIWGEGDSVIKRSAQQEIYNRLPSQHKQLIVVKGYPGLKADHYFPMNKSYFFGGRNGISAFHFHGAWKWMMGAVLDAQGGRSITNPYLYGEEAASSGDSSIRHSVTRSW